MGMLSPYMHFPACHSVNNITISQEKSCLLFTNCLFDQTLLFTKIEL